jgi:hypothetical protein
MRQCGPNSSLTAAISSWNGARLVAKISHKSNNAAASVDDIALANTASEGPLRFQIGRGRLSILDVEGLHAAAFDCYERIERRYDELLGPLRQDSV